MKLISPAIFIAVLGLAACGGAAAHDTPATSAAPVAAPQLTPLPRMPPVVCAEAKLLADGIATYPRMVTVTGMMYVDKHMTIPTRAEINTYLFQTVTRHCPQLISQIPVP